MPLTGCAVVLVGVARVRTSSDAGGADLWDRSTLRSDSELLADWRAGDKRAGNELLQRHFPTLFRFLRSKLTQGVEDFAHETMLACLEGADRFKGPSFRAFMLGIARHKLLRYFRKKQREQRALRVAETSLVELQGTPSRILAAADLLGALEAALREIPLDQQITLELFYWENLSVVEIATVLDVREGTVKSRLARARDQLQQRLREADALEKPWPRDVRWHELIRELAAR